MTTTYGFEIFTRHSRIDFYDQPAQVDVAVAAAVEHFRAHL